MELRDLNVTVPIEEEAMVVVHNRTERGPILSITSADVCIDVELSTYELKWLKHHAAAVLEEMGEEVVHAPATP